MNRPPQAAYVIGNPISVIGLGLFTAVTFYHVYLGDAPWWVVVGDVDGDDRRRQGLRERAGLPGLEAEVGRVRRRAPD